MERPSSFARADRCRRTNGSLVVSYVDRSTGVCIPTTSSSASAARVPVRDDTTLSDMRERFDVIASRARNAS